MAGADKVSASDRAQGSGTSIFVPSLLLLLRGGGAGFGYGKLFGGAGTSADSHAASAKYSAGAAVISKASALQAGEDGVTDWRNEELVPVQPLIVRLSGSKGKWLRLEGAVAFSLPAKEGRATLVAQLGEDLMLFLGSTELDQLTSPTGLEFLRDDMNEIVQSRTKGQGKRFILKSLVVE
ncbi:MAG: flagellar basal body-associated FliL family protein [Hyphomicrobiaceae bacterium]